MSVELSLSVASFSMNEGFLCLKGAAVPESAQKGHFTLLLLGGLLGLNERPVA